MVTIPCRDLERSLAFLTEELGFRLDMIMPADDPTVAVVSGHGTALRLEEQGPSGDLRRSAPEPFVDGLVVTRPGDDTSAPGRAGMRYRDLVPDRRGGDLIASHISIPDGGPVPDYVHHHEGIRFQIIYCVAGWVRVVYEDQGPPFLLEPGDCVLQPPGIRHRVLETSPGAQVVEVSSPAVHETHVDHRLTLPTADVRPDRSWGGQGFVRHRAADAPWTPWRLPGWEAGDTGIGEATAQLVGVRVVRPTGATRDTVSGAHDGELLLWYVLAGSLRFTTADGADEAAAAGTTIVVPAGLAHRIAPASPNLEMLEVTVPGDLPEMRAPIP